MFIVGDGNGVEREVRRVRGDAPARALGIMVIPVVEFTNIMPVNSRMLVNASKMVKVTVITVTDRVVDVIVGVMEMLVVTW
jgi:hypothetical protein